MNSEANREIVTRFMEAASRGDMKPFGDAMHERYTFRPMAPSRRGVWKESYEGKDNAIRNFFRRWHAQLEGGLSMTPTLILADGDHVVVESKGSARMKETGLPYCQSYCQVLRMENGLILEAREYFDSGLADALFKPV